MGSGDRSSPLLDRSSVRILLCDKDPDKSQQVLQLLRKCSYQVIAVATAREVIGVLNAESEAIDLILAEVDLPKSKGFKMLKYITREKHLQRIPLVMMSSQDEVAVVMKCLKLGAADYLVKPLRINELLNLWIHMWRRRRMLGLAEKSLIGTNLIHDLDLLVSDPSESNTNSTTLFSDDTDDKKVRTHGATETSTPTDCRECKSGEFPVLELSLKRSSDLRSEPLDTIPPEGKYPFPNKSELKLGKSSAFLTYVKTTNQAGNINSVSEKTTNQAGNINSVSEKVSEKTLPKQLVFTSQKQDLSYSSKSTPNDAHIGHSQTSDEITPSTYNGIHCDGNGREGVENRSSSLCGTPVLNNGEIVGGEPFPTGKSGIDNERQSFKTSCVPSLSPPQLIPSMINHHPLVSSPSMHLSAGASHDIGKHVSSGMTPFHSLQPCQGVPVNPPISFYPFRIHVAPGQIPSHGWSPLTNVSISEPKFNHMERREAALNKFRQKRKDRCFDKKIRYVSRKRLAEQRPRIKGQFVRQINDVEAGPSLDDSEEDNNDYGHGLAPESSPENLAGDNDDANY